MSKSLGGFRVHDRSDLEFHLAPAGDGHIVVVRE